MKYTDRQVSRGFGFCIFEDPQSAELAMETKVHVIDGRKVLIFLLQVVYTQVDVRWALPKEMAPPPQASGILYQFLPLLLLVEQVAKPAVRKIFVGGLSVDTHDSMLLLDSLHLQMICENISHSLVKSKMQQSCITMTSDIVAVLVSCYLRIVPVSMH